MEEPQQGEELTQEQVDHSLNIEDFEGAQPGGKPWHQGPDGGGQFEPWALEYGYPEGFPFYANVKVGEEDFHIYYLNDGNAAPVILRPGQTPRDYGIEPRE